jgi:hypothetical protein
VAKSKTARPKKPAARWERARLYALTPEQHIWHARFAFMRCLGHLHPEFVDRLVDEIGPPIELRLIKLSPTHPPSGRGKLTVEALADLDSLLNDINLGGIDWVRDWAIDLVAQNAAATQEGRERGRQFWSVMGQPGFESVEASIEARLVPHSAPLVEHRRARLSGRLSMRELFPWNPLEETLEAFELRIADHVNERKEWAHETGLTPTRVGYQPDEFGGWDASDVFWRTLRWVVQRKVDGLSPAKISELEQKQTLEPRRVVQRESTALAKYLGLSFE